MEQKVAVIGLGYVGLPLALHLAKNFQTVGFDIDQHRVSQLNKHIDVTDEGYEEELKKTSLVMTADPAELKSCNFFIVGVPTPVDDNHNPDLLPLKRAC